MKIHCLCLVKNEADILAEVVESALKWADTIIMADNGSSDGTREIIRQLAKNRKIIVLEGYDVPFRDNLRARMFHEVKHIAKCGDWWCRLDADEMYIDHPGEFLGKIPAHIDTVWSSHFNYHFTEHDLAEYQKDPQAFLSLPVSKRLRYYLNEGSEPRFVKHRFPFVWNWAWPTYRFFSSPHRIRLAQYQYRSPEQISDRLKTRMQAFRQSGGVMFPHEITRGMTGEYDFMQRVKSTDGLDHDDGRPLRQRPECLPVIWPLKPKGVPKTAWIPCILFQIIRHCFQSKGLRFSKRKDASMETRAKGA